MSASSITQKIYAWLFILTGIFAIAGALYTWGAGWLFSQNDLALVLIPMADLLMAGPFSLLAGGCLLAKKRWGVLLGMVVSGIYLFGAVQVFIVIFWNGQPYPWQLIVPPLFGISIASGFIMWVYRHEVS